MFIGNESTQWCDVAFYCYHFKVACCPRTAFLTCFMALIRHQLDIEHSQYTQIPAITCVIALASFSLSSFVTLQRIRKAQTPLHRRRPRGEKMTDCLK